MNVLIQWAIKAVLNWAYGLTREDFDLAFKYVQEAAKRFSESSDKKQFVQEALAKLMPDIGGRALNLLIELAVARLGKLQAK